MARKKIAEKKPLRRETAHGKALRPMTGTATAADITELLAKAPPTTPDGPPAPITRLHRKHILAAQEGVFQWRRCERDPVRSGAHIAELVRALQNTGRPFEPLLVFPAGGKYYVMDGHHRLAAYQAANWDEPVPVELFRGSLREARLMALQTNSKDKLPMRREDKAEAVWLLVKEDNKEMSKQQLKDLGLVSYGTVGTMRAKWREIKDVGDDNLRKMSWGQAKLWTTNQEIEQDPEGWRERKIQKLVERLVKAGLAKELGKRPDMVVEALCRIAPHLPRTIVAELDPEDEVFDWMRDRRSEDGRRAYHQDEEPMHEF